MMKRKRFWAVVLSMVMPVSLYVPVMAENSNTDLSEQSIENDCHDMTDEWFERDISIDETDPVEDLINRYGEIRNSVVMNEDIDIVGLEKCADSIIVEDEILRKQCINEMQESMLIDIVDAETTMTINDTHEEDGIITADVSEWIFYDYDDLENEECLIDVSGYGVEHEIKISHDGDNYKIISDAYSEEDMSGMISSSYVQDEIDEEQEELFGIASEYEASLSIASVSYNVSAAVAYSEQYISHSANGTNNESYYNSAYPNFNSSGGDCANYVSQCIHAGGIPMGGNWYCYSKSNVGSAWISSSSMRSYMAANYGNLVTSPSSSDIWVGSPVYYVWSSGGGHSTICVGKNSSGTPVVNSHNNDRYHVKWNYGGSGTTYYTVQIAGNNPTTDLGDDFYAFIINTSSWKMLTNDNVNVSLRTSTASDNQKWHFVKESDGSYRIYSLIDGNCLDVYNLSSESGANVQVYPYNTSGAQNWDIYGNSGEYKLSARCTDCFLDVEGGSYEEGTNIQMWSGNDTIAQKFSIYRFDNLMPQYATLSIDKAAYKVGEQIKFTSRSDNATKYYTSIYRGDTLVQGSDITSDYSRSFDTAGDYHTWISAYNSTGSIDSNHVYFTVYDRKPEIPTVITDKEVYSENETVIINIDCENITTSSSLGINKLENGAYKRIETPNVTGESLYKYTPSEPGNYCVYVTAANDCGYSDSKMVYFDVGRYSITYNSNGGMNTPQNTIKIYGQEAMISSTEPEREGYSFKGWNTKADGTGMLYNAGDIYTEDKDITLYAQWELVSGSIEPSTPKPYTSSIAITAGDISAKPGDTIEVPITISDNTGFANLSLEVDYDESVLTLTEVKKNAEVDATFVASRYLTVKPYFLSWNSLENTVFNGTLVTLIFTVSDEAEDGDYAVSVDYYKGESGNYSDGVNINYDEDFEPLGLTYKNGTVTVLDHVPGDVSGDGMLDARDGTFILRKLAGWDIIVNEKALDINGDSVFDAKDGTFLLRRLAGWDIIIY